MSDCGQELCEGWTGEGCACAVFGIEFAISGLTQQELHGPLEPPATVCVRLDGLAEDDMDHAEMEELIAAAKFIYCDYDDGSGDDGNPAFALIRIDGQWRAVCAFHAQAAAAGEMERNWIEGSTEQSLAVQ